MGRPGRDCPLKPTLYDYARLRTLLSPSNDRLTAQGNHYGCCKFSKISMACLKGSWTLLLPFPSIKHLFSVENTTLIILKIYCYYSLRDLQLLDLPSLGVGICDRIPKNSSEESVSHKEVKIVPWSDAINHEKT